MQMVKFWKESICGIASGTRWDNKENKTTERPEMKQAKKNNF